MELYLSLEANHHLKLPFPPLHQMEDSVTSDDIDPALSLVESSLSVLWRLSHDPNYNCDEDEEEAEESMDTEEYEE